MNTDGLMHSNTEDTEDAEFAESDFELLHELRDLGANGPSVFIGSIRENRG